MAGKRKTNVRKAVTAKSPKKQRAREIKDFKPSREAVVAAKAAMAILPGNMQSHDVAMLLMKTLYNGRFRREFRASPRAELEKLGVKLPDNVKIDVHENGEDTLHIVLPGVAMDLAPSKSAGKPALPLAAFEGAKGGGVDIRDIDMQSGPSVMLLNDDVRNKTNGKDPTAADRKGDGRTGGDTVNYFLSNNDPRVKDTADTGKD